MSSQCKVLCSRPPGAQGRKLPFSYGIAELHLCWPYQLFKEWPHKFDKRFAPRPLRLTAVNVSFQVPLELHGKHVTRGCGISIHRTEHSKLSDEHFVYTFHTSVVLFVLVFLSVIFIRSSIFIRQEANWLGCFEATHLVFFGDFKVMIWRFVIATGGEWV